MVFRGTVQNWSDSPLSLRLALFIGTLGFMDFRVAGIALLLSLLCFSRFVSPAAAGPVSDDTTLTLPQVGSYRLRIIDPTTLELFLVTKKNPDPARLETWNFVNGQGQLALPASSEFQVDADGQKTAVQAAGFKRRALYAPLKQRDLRVANYLYLRLAAPVPENKTVTVQNPSHKLWPEAMQFITKSDAGRWSPVIHVNQTGYLTDQPKKAEVGYYLGSLGELPLGPDRTIDPAKAAPSPGFELFEAA